jgi:hypothetical protein
MEVEMPTLHALYRTLDDGESTYRGLVEMGVPVEQLGLLLYEPEEGRSRGNEVASGAKTGAAVGAVFGGGTGLLAGIGSIVIPGFGPVLAMGWWAATLVAAIGGAATGAAAGSLTGKLVEAGLPEESAHRYVEGLSQGHVFVTARVDPGLASGTEAILSKYHPIAFDRAN